MKRPKLKPYWNIFYVNFAKLTEGRNTERSVWEVCWNNAFFGSARQDEAVSLRRAWLKELQTDTAVGLWTERDVKTKKVRIRL